MDCLWRTQKFLNNLFVSIANCCQLLVTGQWLRLAAIFGSKQWHFWFNYKAIRRRRAAQNFMRIYLAGIKIFVKQTATVIK